jgi:hypothetical protein
MLEKIIFTAPKHLFVDKILSLLTRGDRIMDVRSRLSDRSPNIKKNERIPEKIGTRQCPIGVNLSSKLLVSLAFT